MIEDPIITLRMEGMRKTLHQALMVRAEEFSEYVDQAIKSACTKARIQEIVDHATEEVIKDSIKKEIEAFYRYGEGRDIIKKRVVEMLNENS